MNVDNMFKCLLVLVSTVTWAYAAQAIYPYEPKPPEFADQEGCYIKDLNRVLPYNKPYYPKKEGTCVQYTCGTNNETKLVSCGVLGYPDYCHLEKDFTLDYPKCCGTLVCDTTTPPPTTETTTELCVTVTETPGLVTEPAGPIDDPPNPVTEPEIPVTEPPGPITEPPCPINEPPTRGTKPHRPPTKTTPQKPGKKYILPVAPVC